MKTPFKILQILSDGKFHSGEEIGAVLGITRSAIWKSVKQLEELDIEIHAVPKRGYCVPDGFELLDEQKIREGLEQSTIKLMGDLDVLTEVDSTTNYVRAKAKQNSICLAEQQTAGRGRRGRQWFSPFGRNIYLSLLHRFSNGPAALAGLSLATSIAVVEALQALGVADIGIKWPNDIVHRKQKLAGILLDISGDAAGPCDVVISVGLNVSMSVMKNADVDQPWVDLTNIVGVKLSRNHIAGVLLNSIFAMLQTFEVDGFAEFVDRWNEFDILSGQPVVIHTSTGDVHGIAAGISQSGEIQVNVNNEIQVFNSGEVSVRYSA